MVSAPMNRSEEHTSELQSQSNLVCRLLLEKKKFTTNLRRRLKDHNSGLVSSTRQRRPFDLVYWEGCLNQTDATQREKYLKSSWGTRYIKNRLWNYLTG